MVKRAVCCFSLSLILGILYGRAGELRYLVFLAVLAGCCSLTLLLSQKNCGKNGPPEKGKCLPVSGGENTLVYRMGRVALARSLLCLLLFAAGAARFQAQWEVQDRLEGLLSQEEPVTVQGRVIRKEEKAQVSREEGMEQVPIEEGAVQASGTEKKAQQFIYYLGDVQVILGGKAYPGNGVLVYSSGGQYQTGNILRADGRYVPFQISRNQGNFNEKQYQQSRKWDFCLYAESETLVSAEKNKYAVWLEGLRQSFRNVFAGAMEPEDAGVMANLALGDKSRMEPEVKALYQKSGISHILAISGLHVSLLGMGIWKLLLKSGCPQKLASLLSFGAVYSFGLMSGMAVSTGRAVGMFGLLLAARALGYSYDSLTALSLNAMVQLWENPFLLEYAGFLFSYGAVLGVTVVYRIVRETAEKSRVSRENGIGHGQKEKPRGFFQRVGGKLMDTMLASFCIQLATLPLSLYFYYEIPGYSIIVNACVLPFLGTLLFLGFLGGAVGSVFPAWGVLLLKPAGWILAAWRDICGFFLELPGASLVLGRPPLELMAAYYGTLAACLYLARRKGRKRWLTGIAAALCSLALLRGKPCFEINLLDVGQGDGIMIQTGAGECFFVDGGSSDVKSVGTYRILPFLKSRGIPYIKGWVVSHADTDHISGLCEILEQGYPVEYLVLAKGMVRDEAMAKLLEAAAQAGCKVVYAAPGMKFGTEDTVFTVLWPRPFQEGQDRNGACLSVAVEHQGFTGVFTGDIGEEQEQELMDSGVLEQYGLLPVDFYKAAHHGSNGSNCREFLEALSPKVSVVSCGAKNHYGHPGTEAVERMAEAGSSLFYTMDQGQIRIVPGKQGIQVWTYLP